MNHFQKATLIIEELNKLPGFEEWSASLNQFQHADLYDLISGNYGQYKECHKDAILPDMKES